jgi:hypothetical protein
LIHRKRWQQGEGVAEEKTSSGDGLAREAESSTVTEGEGFVEEEVDTEDKTYAFRDPSHPKRGTRERLDPERSTVTEGEGFVEEEEVDDEDITRGTRERL